MDHLEYQKYNNWVRMIYDNYFPPLKFDVDIAKEISFLRDDAIVKTYDENKWNSLIDIASEKESAALVLALVNCKHFNEECFNKLYKKLDDKLLNCLLTSEYVPDDIIKDITTKIIDKDRLETEGKDYSQKVINFLCTNPLLTKYNYLPLKYLDKSSEIAKHLSEYLENQDFFKEDVPYDFVLNIAQNEKLTDNIRDKAFDIGYDPETIDNMTNYMRKEQYKMCADTLFDCSLDINNNQDKKILDAVYINRVWDIKNLPESCQLDFIDRYFNRNIDNKYIENILTNMLRYTEEPNVLVYAINKLHSTHLIKNGIMKNARILTDSVIKEMLKIIPAQDTVLAFTQSLFHNQYSDTIFHIFLNSVNDINMNRAMIASVYTTPNQIDMLMSDKRIKAKYKKVFEYLGFVRKYCLKSLPVKKSEKILMKATQLFVNNETDTEMTENKYVLCNKLNVSEQWFALKPAEYEILKEMFKELKDNFPNFTHITNKLEEKTNRVYKQSEFVFKYPNIFTTDYNYTQKFPVPFSFFDVEKLCDMNENERNEFIKDLSMLEAGDSIASYIISQLDKKFYELHFSSFNSHNELNLIYRLVDVYNTALEIYDKQYEKEIQQTEKNDSVNFII